MDDIRIPKNDRYEIFIIRVSSGAVEQKIAEIRSPGLVQLLLPNFREIYPPPEFALRICKAGVYNPDIEGSAYEPAGKVIK